MSAGADDPPVERLQLLFVAAGWLLVAAAAVRRRIRRLPHDRWLAALETLRGWDVTAERAAVVLPRQRVPLEEVADKRVAV